VKKATVLLLFTTLLSILPFFPEMNAQGHEIYSLLHDGITGTKCCGDDDCGRTLYRYDKVTDEYSFLTREQVWVVIPKNRINFHDIPHDDPTKDPDFVKSDSSHRAHLCYRRKEQMDRVVLSSFGQNVFGPIYLFCAWIPVGPS